MVLPVQWKQPECIVVVGGMVVGSSMKGPSDPKGSRYHHDRNDQHNDGCRDTGYGKVATPERSDRR